MMRPIASRTRLACSLATVFMVSTISFGQEFVLLGWNDLGMHCANRDFSKIAVLPPFNNVRAQLIRRNVGGLPRAVTAGYTVEYSIPSNTTSVTKTNFWQYAQALFGLAQPLTPNIGLTGKGLTGVMDTTENYFEAKGIPVTPYADSNLVSESPYQLIHLVAKNSATDSIVAATDVVIPVSNEIGCVQSGCHGSESAVLNAHESMTGFNKSGPVLCATCHASNALGTAGTSSAMPFSYRIHRQHRTNAGAARDITTCYKCHPGPKTQCFRDVMRVGITSPLICQDCHGTMDTLSLSITGQGRRPWLDEPKCGTCHGTNFSEESGKLFRQSRGHGNLFCSACHGSPHAIVPTREANDNLQSIRLQGYAGPLRVCSVCHQNVIPVHGPHGLDLTSVSTKVDQVPSGFALRQNYPNPFNPSTRIRFELPEMQRVTIGVYNNAGQQIRTLATNLYSAGVFDVTWDGRDDRGEAVATGLYLCRLTGLSPDGGSAGRMATVKMLLLR